MSERAVRTHALSRYYVNFEKKIMRKINLHRNQVAIARTGKRAHAPRWSRELNLKKPAWVIQCKSKKIHPQRERGITNGKFKSQKRLARETESEKRPTYIYIHTHRQKRARTELACGLIKNAARKTRGSGGGDVPSTIAN